MSAIVRGAGGVVDTLPWVVSKGRALARSGGPFHFPLLDRYHLVETPMGTTLARFHITPGQVAMEYPRSGLRFQVFGDGQLSSGVRQKGSQHLVVPATVSDYVAAEELATKAYEWLA